MKEFQLGLQEDFNSDCLKLLPGDRIYVAYVWTWLSDDDDDDGDENRLSDDDPDSDDCHIQMYWSKQRPELSNCTTKSIKYHCQWKYGRRTG